MLPKNRVLSLILDNIQISHPYIIIEHVIKAEPSRAKSHECIKATPHFSCTLVGVDTLPYEGMMVVYMH